MNECKSAQPCGCDEGARHECARHAKDRILAEIDKKIAAGYGDAAKDFDACAGVLTAYQARELKAGLASVGFTGFTVKDSGTRQHFQSGMQRDVTTDKTDYSLVLDGPMFERWATHLTKGAKKYTKRNWMQANSQEELDRFRESALRHFLQWYRGEVDEDHASAVLFNVNGAEYTRGRL